MNIRRRAVNLTGFLACALMLAYALFAQFQQNLEPCPLCIFQRVGIATLGVVFLIAALHHPRSRAGRISYAVLIALAAAITAGVAARHVYVQHAPAGSIPACGAPLDSMLQMFPIAEVIRKVLSGGGECAVVNWTLFGLSMPAWVLTCAIALGLTGLLANLKAR